MSMYENEITLEFQVESDKDYVLQFIADSCRKQELNGTVIVTEGTLQTRLRYEHDGS